MTHHQTPDRLALLDDLLRDRHSCRGFRPAPVPRPVIEQILTSAQRTASWTNLQPWSVHIIGGAALNALRDELVERSAGGAPPAPELDWPSEIRGRYLERKRDCGWGLYRTIGIEKGDRAASARFTRENFRLFGAPHLAVISSDAALGTHGVMDCGGWVMTFMLAAEAAGVATLAQAALAAWPDVLRRHLPIDPDHRIICGISFGYEDPTQPANRFRTTRAPLDEVVTWTGD